MNNHEISSDGESDVNRTRNRYLANDDGVRSNYSGTSNHTSGSGGASHASSSTHNKRNLLQAIQVKDSDNQSTVPSATASSHRTNDIRSAMNTRPLSRKHSLHTAGVTIKAESDLVDFRAALLNVGKYRIHKHLLHFEEPEVEQGYCQFMYHNSGFYGGKLWHAVALIVTVLMLMLYHPFGAWFRGGSGMLGHWAWIGMDISFVTTALTTVCLFVPRLFPYREPMYILSLMTHWPSYAITMFHGKDPHTLTYAIPLCCFFFCTFITFARFRNVIFFLSLTPLITLLSVTFAVKDYWEKHSQFEMFIWPAVFPCILTMRAFEIRSRLCYAEVRMAQDQLELTDEKSLITQKMVASFFPPTTAADLLSEKELVTSRQYTETVLIQSDLEGFTAHSAITDPSQVVQMLTQMFEFIDELAPQHGVEKLATVGDAYLGVSFPTHPLCYESHVMDAYEQEMARDPMASEVPLAARISAVIAFGCKFIGVVPELRMRVGVAHGTVTAGFVGDYPPKLDVFGQPVQHVGEMERMGTPGYIHVAQESIDLALTVGTTTADGPPSQVAAVLVPGWLEDESRGFTDHVDVLNTFVDTKTDRIMAHLSKFGDELNDIKQLKRTWSARTGSRIGKDEGRSSVIRIGDLDTDTTDLRTEHFPEANDRRSSIYSQSMNLDEEVDCDTATLITINRTKDVSTNDVGFTMFHPVWLYFREPEVEERFKEFLHDSQIIKVSQQLLMVLQFIIATAMLGLICVDVKSNRLITIFSMIMVMVIGGYLRFVGTDHKYNMACIWTLYMIPCLLNSMLSSDCDEPGPMKGYYSGVAWSLYTITWQTAPYFCIDVRMWVRMVVIIGTSALTLAMVPLHEHVVGRYDVHYDWYIAICAVASMTVAFFLDYNVRSAFAACVRVRRAVSKSRRRHARVAKKCIDTMLPRFVSDELIRPASGEEDVREDHALEIHTEHMLWEYPRAICMFINFRRVDGKDCFVERVDSTVKAMEKIFAREGVQKVKSIQNTVLVVSGIDRNSNPQHCAVRMLTAALDVVAELAVEDIELRCGLHTGPCFGAVIGNTGLSFDIFGDTVNTASRIQSCAAPNTVQFSKPFKELLGRFGIRFQIEQLESVDLKGKGVTDVFSGALLDRSGDAASTINAPSLPV